MKCPECVKEGEKSCVEVGASTVTAMHVSPFYDEEGDYHVHDGNTRTRYFGCDRGHAWSVHEPNKCPNPKCDWTSKSWMEAGLRPTVIKEEPE